MFLVSINLYSQIVDTTGVTIKGSRVYINSGTSLYLDGNLYNVSTTSPFAATTKGEILNNDTIFVAGNILNSITKHPLFLFGGTVSLRYDFPQYFSRDTLNFHNLVINKPLNNLILQRNISVANRFELIKGKADILSSNIDLLDNGRIIGETFQNYIFSNDGWIIARNRLVNPSFNGDVSSLKLELYPTSDNLGLTTIFRRNKIQDSLVKGSIQRMYDVYPSNVGNSGILFNYYDAEWQSLPNEPKENKFKLFKSNDVNVLQGRLSSWAIQEGSTVNTNTNQVSMTDFAFNNTGVRLTVADGDCDANFRFAIPTEPIWFCNGDSIVIDAGAGAQKYLWSNGATTQTITINAAKISGVKDTLDVVAYNSAGCISHKGIEVNVFPKPVANFTTISSVCEGNQALFTNTSTISLPHGLSYLWTFFDNTTSTSVNAAKIYVSDGTFATKLVATSVYGCKDSITKSIIVQPKPLADFSVSQSEQCLGQIISLNNGSSVSSGAIGQSIWTFGDGFSSTLSGINALDGELKAYNASGNYSIKLKVRSSGNCVDSTLRSVLIHPLPKANFTATNFITNSPTSFSNTSSISSGYSLSYLWNFGDGIGTSSNVSTSYTYPASGTYSVSLQVESNKSCVDIKTQTVTITSLPIANFSVSSLDACANTNLIFLNISTVDAGVLTYNWDFGDGTTSTQLNPSKIYTNPGTYTIVLQVTSGSNLTATTSKTVIIRPVPKAQYTANSVCFGNANSFINTTSISSGSFNSLWTMADGFVSAETSPTHLFSTTGSFSVKLKTTSIYGCADSTESSVFVNANPVADFSFNTACLGEATGFVNNSTISTGNFGSFWNLGNGTTSTQASPILTYAAAGNYNVVLTISSDKGCSAILTKQITVHDVPIVNFSASIACQGDSTIFTNLSTINEGNLNFDWNFSVTNSNLTNPVIVFPTANTYNVILTAISDKGCSKSISKNIDVKPLPRADFSVANACLGIPLQFVNTSSIVAIPSESGLSYQWNLGNGISSTSQNPSATFVTPNDYLASLIATSSFGCKDKITKTVTIYPNPTVAFTISDACMEKLVTINNTSSVTGGTLSYDWNFNDGTSSTLAIPNKSFNIAKIHTVDLKVISNQGCEAIGSRSLNIRPKPNLNFFFQPSICVGSPLSITDLSNISTGGFSRNWQFGNGQTSSLINPTVNYSEAGIYNISLSATSDFGCQSEFASVVTVNNAPFADFQVSPKGALGLNFTNSTKTNGIANIAYQWNFGDGQSSTVENESHDYSFTGNYVVSLTANSANNCKSTISKNVKVPYDNLVEFEISGGLCVASAFNFRDQSIFSDNNITYLWNFGDGATSTLKNPSHIFKNDGNYVVSLTVTPQSGIAITKVKSIQVYPLPRVSFSSNISCQAQNANLINTSLDKLNHLFTWYYGDGTEASFENPTKTYNNVGSYPVVLKSVSPQGCQAEYSASVVVSAIPTFSFSDSIFTCGSVYLLDAENAGSTYLWSTNENARSISIFSSGNYNVQVVNNNGCVANKSVFVKLNSPVKINLGKDTVVCSDYILKANQPGSFLWSTGETSNSININTTGNYWVQFTDQNTCSDSDTISLSVIPTPIVNLGVDLIKCSNENIILDAQNEGGGYQWSSGANTQKVAITESGLYHVTVTSANLCSKSDEILVQINDAPLVNLGEDKTVCTNDFPISISTNTLNDVYLWSTGASTNSISVNVAGTYFVTATGSNTCVSKDTVIVIDNVNPTINLGTINTFCHGDTLTLDAGNAGSIFNWSNGSTTQEIGVTTSGKYYVSVVNAFGCSSTASINITKSDLPQLSLSNTYSKCKNQLPLTVIAPGGYSQYLWNTGVSTQSLTTSLAGIYTVKVTDLNGCAATDTIEVKIDEVPLVNLGADTSFCFGSSVTLDAGSLANVDYLWSDGSKGRFKTLTNSGTLSVELTTAAGCKASDEVFVKANPLPIVDLGTDRTLCLGATSNLDALNVGSTYLWTTGETSQTIIAKNNGLYGVTVTNIYNCKASDNVLVDVINLPGKSLPEDVVSCNSITLNAGNPGANYLWSTGANTQVISAKNSGLYIVNITNGNNCLTRDSIMVTIHPKPLINLGKDTTLCKYQSLTLDANNAGATYFWSNLNLVSRTISVSEPGIYTVSVTNQFQCAANDTIKINQNPVPEFNLGADKNICEGTSINLTTNLPVNTQFLWSMGSTSNSISVSSTGTYSLKASFNTGCQFSDTVEVNVRPLPIINLGNDTTVCGKIELDAQNDGSNYVWSNNVFRQTNDVNQSGSYRVVVTTPYGCIAADTIDVTIKTAPIVNLGPDIGACSGEKVVLFANTNADQFKWNTGQTVSNLSIDSPGEYILEGTNANGCKSSDAILISFNPKPILDLKDEYPLCGDNPVELDAQNTGSSYLWTSSGGFISSQQKISITKEGSYFLTVMNGNNCLTKDTIKINKTDFNLTAEFLAVSSVKSGDTIKMVNLSFPAPYTSTWDFGDGLASQETDPLHVYFISGKIDVKLSVSNGICTDVKNKTIFLTARNGFALDSANKSSAFLQTNVYPNPSDGRFILEVTLSEIRKMSLEFYDISGNMLQNSVLEPSDVFHTIFDFPTLPSGIYFLRASLKDEFKIFKVLISK